MSRDERKTSQTHCALILAVLTLACSKNAVEEPPPLSKLLVGKAPSGADLSRPDPNAPFWSEVPSGTVPMTAQAMVAPRSESTTTEKVIVQAVHDQAHLAFRLRWKDAEPSEAGRLGEYSDAFALEFPVGDPLPPVMMGAKGMPVYLLHWRAQYQRDAERGKPDIQDLYPNASVDMYQHDYRGVPGSAPLQAERYSPAKAVGNPQSYRKSSVDEIVAEGFGTSSVQEPSGASARGVWKQGEWTLVIVRPLDVEGRGGLSTGKQSNVAFAAWQGGSAEVASRKSITMQWTPLTIQ